MIEKSPIDPAIRNLFTAYEAAFSALDMRKSAEFFADTFISAGPRGSITSSKAEFLKLADQAAAYYRSVGQTSAKIFSLEENPITNEYSMVKVHWGVTFKKTGDLVIEFDVTYFVQKTGPEPRIIMFIAHQDEQKAMEELGLL
jgi:hypothetical protein